MKFFSLLLIGASAINVDRIPDTQKPFLIPSVMDTDRATKWALCDGTNSGRCREADSFLNKDDQVPPMEDVIHGDQHAKGLLRF